MPRPAPPGSPPSSQSLPYLTCLLLSALSHRNLNFPRTRKPGKSAKFLKIPSCFFVIFAPFAFPSLRALADGDIHGGVIAAAQQTNGHRFAHAVRPQQGLHVVGIAHRRAFDAE